jgi:hypothetical protein
LNTRGGEAKGSGGNARASRVWKGESSAREASLDFCPNPSTDLGFFIDDPTRIVIPTEHRDKESAFL